MEYSINFTKYSKNFSLSLHHNGENSYIFVKGVEIHKFKAKGSEIKATLLCSGNISKDFLVDIMKNKNFIAMFMILVLIIMLQLLMIYYTFTSI